MNHYVSKQVLCFFNSAWLEPRESCKRIKYRDFALCSCFPFTTLWRLIDVYFGKIKVSFGCVLRFVNR